MTAIFWQDIIRHWRGLVDFSVILVMAYCVLLSVLSIIDIVIRWKYRD